MKFFPAFIFMIFFLIGCGGPKQPPSTQDSTTVKKSSAKKLPGDPEKAQRLIQQGADLLGKGFIPAAFKAFEDAIRVAPQDPAGYLALAEAHMRLKNYDQALTALEAVLAFDQGNPEVYYLISVIYGLKGDQELAIRNAQKSAQLSDDQNDRASLAKAVALLHSLLAIQEEQTQGN